MPLRGGVERWVAQRPPIWRGAVRRPEAKSNPEHASTQPPIEVACAAADRNYGAKPPVELAVPSHQSSSPRPATDRARRAQPPIELAVPSPQSNPLDPHPCSTAIPPHGPRFFPTNRDSEPFLQNSPRPTRVADRRGRSPCDQGTYQRLAGSPGSDWKQISTLRGFSDRSCKQAPP